jgi:hypothetical protein
MNAAGVIAGYGDTPAQLIRAKRWWPSGTMEDLPTLGGDDSYAIAIDATSRVWGSADTVTCTDAAVWDVDGTVHDLGTLGGTFATVLGVNNSGLAVGFSLTADDRVMGMYVTHPGVMGALPLLAACAEPFIGCTAEAINNIPQAVGSCWTSAPSPSLVVEHAALWNADGTVVDLNTQIDPGLGWVLQNAQSIDDSGRIVGSGLLHGQRRGYLLTPQLPAMAVTPADAVMSPCGIACLIPVRRRSSGFRIRVPVGSERSAARGIVQTSHAPSRGLHGDKGGETAPVFSAR